MIANAILDFERKNEAMKNDISGHFGNQFQKGQVSMFTFLNKI